MKISLDCCLYFILRLLLYHMSLGLDFCLLDINKNKKDHSGSAGA